LCSEQSTRAEEHALVAAEIWEYHHSHQAAKTQTAAG